MAETTDKARYFLRSQTIREVAVCHLRQLPLNVDKPWVVEIRPPSRTLPQNALMWCLLTDIAKQVVWHGQRLSAEEWKDVLTASLRREQKTVPSLDGQGIVVLGMRTSKMGVRLMSDVIELAYMFGAQQGVKFSEPERNYRQTSW